MHRLFPRFALLFFIACSPGETEPSTDSGSLDTAESADTGGDTGTPIPSWVDPIVPDEPIPGPEGTSETPEEGDFEWTGINPGLIEEAPPWRTSGGSSILNTAQHSFSTGLTAKNASVSISTAAPAAVKTAVQRAVLTTSTTTTR